MNKTTLISLESSTMAIKAKKILIRNGYNVSIEKSVDGNRGGCKSNLRVNSDKDTVCEILNSYGIKCK